MRKKLFGEFVESIKEAGRIHLGEIPPSRLPFDKNQWSDTKNIERALIVRRIRGFLTTRSTNRSGNRS